MKFKFENKEAYDLYQLTPDQTAAVANAYARNYDLLEVLHDGKWMACGTKEMLHRKNTYRVLAKPFTLEDAISGIHDIQDNDDSVSDGAIGFMLKIVNELAASLGDKS